MGGGEPTETGDAAAAGGAGGEMERGRGWIDDGGGREGRKRKIRIIWSNLRYYVLGRSYLRLFLNDMKSTRYGSDLSLLGVPCPHCTKNQLPQSSTQGTAYFKSCSPRRNCSIL